MEDTAGEELIKPSAWENTLMRISLLIARLGLAYLFFSSLFWKLPPRFGCGPGPGFEFTGFGQDGNLVRTSGLCDWIGVEASYADPERRFFVIPNEYGESRFSIGLGPLVQLNGFFVEHIVSPYFGFFGWAIFLVEALIAGSLSLGLLSRGGAFLSLLISLQLMLGLAGVWNPAAQLQEWEWSYHLMILLSIVLLGAAPGRVMGLDALWRPRLKSKAASGHRLARLLLALS